ncbi:MAG: carbamoyltransferase HypF, partial [Desulfovibrionales bacterium]
MIRKQLIVQGQVQGVGFRPFVYRTAFHSGVSGWVKNSPEGVIVQIQGSTAQVEKFLRTFDNSLPPLASITEIRKQDIEVFPDETEFTILKSTGGEGHHVLISPDVATCPDCLGEIFDPEDRRHLYPFTNCTNCGPRYTITRSIPYDRPQTSMACFPMCADCLREYENPLDRRFHAQPNACAVCGPRVRMTDRDGQTIARDSEALRKTADLLASGRIAAIKGLGGFHLACSALHPEAVAELRRRKNRRGKPLAVMVPDIQTARALARISPVEQQWLTGAQRPILLLQSRGCPLLSPNLSPDTDRIGLMLPYTPLHHVLFHFLRSALPPDHPSVLVMTSGNLSSEPIALGNREALSRLAPIADIFLLHDRDILIRCDDSVVRINPATDSPEFFRRARGFTPAPVFLPRKGPSVLGTGPQLKCTLALTKADQAFASQHIGDMENLETLGFWEEMRDHLVDILRIRPELVVADLHPDYLTTRFALEQRDAPVLRLQHHAAHIYAVLAEHRLLEPVLGLALDGTGFGEDGTLWGGECLLVDPLEATHARAGAFSPTLLPGGEAAIREPWRIAQGYLYALGITEPQSRPWAWLQDHGPASRMVGQILEKRINCPVTTSCGRLFDAVSALLGVKLVIDYEGQAAILLDMAAHGAGPGSPLPWTLHEAPAETFGGYPERWGTLAGYELAAAPQCPVTFTIDMLPAVRALVEGMAGGRTREELAADFHATLLTVFADVARRLRELTGIGTVAVSGGSWQNRIFSDRFPALIRERGFHYLENRLVPPNDG